MARLAPGVAASASPDIADLAYCSPERTGRLQSVAIDYRSDYYSLGMTLFELASGILPYDFDEAADSPLGMGTLATSHIIPLESPFVKFRFVHRYHAPIHSRCDSACTYCSPGDAIG